jgi:adenylylsulfate kinase
MIIQIIGLPGSGKTTLAKAIKERTNAIHLNADEVRSDISSDLGFSLEARYEQSRRLGAIARLLSKQGHLVVVDFVCPTNKTREAFGKSDVLIWMNTLDSSRYSDTNFIWEAPKEYDMVIDQVSDTWVDKIIKAFHLFDWSAPTTLQLGRYQPWHEGHEALKDEAHKRTEQVLLGVRNTYATSEKDPLTYEEVKRYIHNNSKERVGTLILRLPNITNIVYGRDVGYNIEQIDLPPEIQAISATQKRKELGI